MSLRKTFLTLPLTLCLAISFLLAGMTPANAQSVRYLNRSVEAGKQIEFQWLNFDERTCKDNGYPKLIIEKAPSLGKYRTKKRKFTQQNGKCKGKRFSVLLVYYVAGRRTGKDNSAFVIRGTDNIRINLTTQIK